MRRAFGFAISLAGILALTSGSALAAAAGGVQPAAISHPVLTAAFKTATVAENGKTTLTFTITNPNASTTLTGIAFSATLPLGHLALSSSTSTRCNGTLTLTAPTSIKLSGANVKTGSLNKCSFSMTVTGIVPGNATFTSSAIKSTNGGTGNTVSPSIAVVRLPELTTTFDKASVSVGTVDHLTFKLWNSNMNTVSLYSIGFTLTLPAGLSATPYTYNNFPWCHVNITATATKITVSGGSLAHGIECDFGADITGSKAGTYTLTTSTVSSDKGAGPKAKTSLTVTGGTAPVKTPAPGKTQVPGSTPAPGETPMAAPSESAGAPESPVATATATDSATATPAASSSPTVAVQASPTPATGAPASADGGSNAPVIVGGVAVVVLGLGGLLRFLFLRRKRSAGESGPTSAA